MKTLSGRLLVRAASVLAVVFVAACISGCGGGGSAPSPITLGTPDSTLLQDNHSASKSELYVEMEQADDDSLIVIVDELEESELEEQPESGESLARRTGDPVIMNKMNTLISAIGDQPKSVFKNNFIKTFNSAIF